MNKLEREIGGRSLSLETGRIAKQANGAVWMQYGETVVLVTACRTKTPEDRGFLPLIVDYREKAYAGGKIQATSSSAKGVPPKRRP